MVEGVMTVMPITTDEDKAQRRLKDAKQLLEVVEKRFGGNAATKKTQRNLLKQQYENFTTLSSKMLDQTFEISSKDCEILTQRQNENVVEEVVDAAQVSTAATTVTITTEYITLAQALKALKTSKPKVKGIVFEEPAFQRVNTFEDFRTELVEGKNKRAGTELIQENTKKQKVDDDKEIAELKQCLEIIPDEEEVTTDANDIGLDLLSLERLEDLEDLYKLVKARYGSTRPVESMDYLLWNDMKIMFEPHVENEVWKLQQGYKVLEWKLYDSCGVHSLMNAVYAYLHVGREEVSSYTTYTFNDVGKEASN
ncbi:hypothetical protein Tco_1228114 [Tanacetum coccineum]